MNPLSASPQPPAFGALKGLYAAYMGAVGLMVTYWPLWMASLGMTESQVGLTFSVRTLIAIGAQPLLTLLADRWGRPVLLLRIVLVVALLCGAPLPWVTSALVVAVVLWIQTPAEAATLPLIDSTVLRQTTAEQFARVRVYGSAGYGVAVGVFGWACSGLSDAQAGWTAVVAFVALYAVASLFSLAVPEPQMGRKAEPVAGAGSAEGTRAGAEPGVESGAVTGWESRVAYPPGGTRVLFLVVCGLHYAAVAMYNNLLGLYGASLGYSPAATGAAVALAVGAEIVLFRFAPAILGRAPAHVWWIAVFVSGVFRWSMTAWAPSSGVWIAVQALHFFGFGVWFTQAMRVLGTFGPPERRATLQGVFAASVLAAGGMVGSALGGWLMEWDSGRATFVAAAVLEGVALALLLVTRPTWAGFRARA